PRARAAARLPDPDHPVARQRGLVRPRPAAAARRTGPALPPGPAAGHPGELPAAATWTPVTGRIYGHDHRTDLAARNCLGYGCRHTRTVRVIPARNRARRFGARARRSQDAGGPMAGPDPRSSWREARPARRWPYQDRRGH